MSASPGLYIHFPFCARRCPYCDFYSISALEMVPKYIESLAKEVARCTATWPQSFSTLYIGGGSPSLLNKEGWDGLMEALAPLDLSQVKEFTLEANPEDINSEQADLWAKKGVNRLSVGVQSLDDRFLGPVLGRGHSAEDNRRALALLATYPFELSLDLIYGLPSQNLEDWGHDLMRAVELKPHHLSAYALTVAPNSPLAKSISDRLLPPLPPPDKIADFFLLTGQALVNEGFYRYEVSNFARPGYESAHNLKYWLREPYLGLGPSAHSFDGIKRWANPSSVRQWASALASGATPRAWIEDLDETAIRLETVMLALRLPEGLPEDYLAGSPRLEEFLQSGHLIRTEHRIRPTEKGLLMADRLAVELTMDSEDNK